MPLPRSYDTNSATKKDIKHTENKSRKTRSGSSGKRFRSREMAHRAISWRHERLLSSLVAAGGIVLPHAGWHNSAKHESKRRHQKRIPSYACDIRARSRHYKVSHYVEGICFFLFFARDTIRSQSNFRAMVCDLSWRKDECLRCVRWRQKNERRFILNRCFASFVPLNSILSSCI